LDRLSNIQSIRSIIYEKNKEKKERNITREEGPFADVGGSDHEDAGAVLQNPIFFTHFELCLSLSFSRSAAFLPTGSAATRDCHGDSRRLNKSISLLDKFSF
jgi:hypothetical protein